MGKDERLEPVETFDGAELMPYPVKKSKKIEGEKKTEAKIQVIETDSKYFSTKVNLYRR